MCPLRFILVFISAALAGYLALRTIRSPPPPSSNDDSSAIPTSNDDLGEKRGFDCRKVIRDGFWVFVDMASGRYLWKAMKEKV